MLLLVLILVTPYISPVSPCPRPAQGRVSHVTKCPDADEFKIPPNPQSRINPNTTLKDNDTAVEHGVVKPSTISQGEETFLGLLIALNLILSVLCITMNTVTAPYYWHSASTKIVSMLYFCTSVTDILAGIGVLLQMIVLLFMLLKALSPVFSYLSILSYIISGISIRFGVFLNVVLGALRSINIARPFYQVHRSWLIVGILVYFCIWSGLMIYDCYWLARHLDFTDHVQYMIKSVIFKSLVGFATISDLSEGSGSYFEKISILKFLPFLLPTILFLVFLFIQLYHLICANKRELSLRHTGNPGNISERERNKPARTILILTVIFVVCTSMSAVLWVAVYWDMLHSREKIKYLTWNENFFIYISSSTCNILSSTLMPLTLIASSTALRRYIKRVCRCSRQRTVPVGPTGTVRVCL